MLAIHVPPHGPLDAPVLWVGEAPGKLEVQELRPFIGPSGKFARATLRAAGVDPDKEVRWTNACKINPGTFPAGAKGGALLAEFAHELDAEIAEMPNLRVIVACGGVALLRLAGADGITKWRGSVLRRDDVSERFEVGGGVTCVRAIPQACTLHPVLHPAAIVTSGHRDDQATFRRDVRKVARAVRGVLRAPPVEVVRCPPPHVVLEAARRAKWVYLDTEYNGDTKEVYLVGMTFDGRVCYSMPWGVDYAGVVAAVCAMEHLVKGAHHILADVEALEKVGVALAGEWWDTMLGFHALYPGFGTKSTLTGLSLADAAAFYLDDVKYWKEMAHDDPVYNAQDVIYGALCMLAQWAEAAGRPVDPTAEMKVRMRLAKVTYGMTQRGIEVDAHTRRGLLDQCDKEIVSEGACVEEFVKPMWERVEERTRARLGEQVVQRLALDAKYAGACRKHKYNGMRERFPQCEVCEATWVIAAGDRANMVGVKRSIKRYEKALKGMGGGFRVTNPEHFSWLLHSPSALGLPVQYDHKTKRPTVATGAIDKLLALKKTRETPGAIEVIQHIRRAKYLKKAKSTFLSLEKDGHSIVVGGRVHPSYKVHGTTTGRLASGDDEADERADNRLAINALNIPREWRRMYVSGAGRAIVYADWVNVEGRLTAHFSRDPSYQLALDRELQGGAKVHAINAGIIYGIEPSDAKDYLVSLGGRRRAAYEAGKRLTHAWGYGAGPRTLARQYLISEHEARIIDRKLSEAYPTLVAWRRALVDKVLGVWEGERCVQEGTKYIANPFGWQKMWFGLGAGQANEVIAFLPQSSGAGMLERVAIDLEPQYDIMTATYDSFALLVPDSPSEIRAGVEVLRREMQRTWSELGGRWFPCEVEVGWNWGEVSDDNPRGLREYDG